jgi:hypothetical protein
VFWVLIGIWVGFGLKVRELDYADWVAAACFVQFKIGTEYMKELRWVMCDMVLPAKIEKGVAMVVKIHCLPMTFVRATISAASCSTSLLNPSGQCT